MLCTVHTIIEFKVNTVLGLLVTASCGIQVSMSYKQPIHGPPFKVHPWCSTYTSDVPLSHMPYNVLSIVGFRYERGVFLSVLLDWAKAN